MHIRNITSSIALKTGLMRKCFKALDNDDPFILPCFEYCSLVWCSGAETDLKLLNRTLDNILFRLSNMFVDLEYRRKIASF